MDDRAAEAGRGEEAGGPVGVGGVAAREVLRGKGYGKQGGDGVFFKGTSIWLGMDLDDTIAQIPGLLWLWSGGWDGMVGWWWSGTDASRVSQRGWGKQDRRKESCLLNVEADGSVRTVFMCRLGSRGGRGLEV